MEELRRDEFFSIAIKLDLPDLLNHFVKIIIFGYIN